MENHITKYNGIDIYAVTGVEGTFYYYESQPGLLEVFECISVLLQPTNKTAEIKFLKYFISPEHTALIDASFPNITPTLLRESSYKIENVLLPFTVQSAVYAGLFSIYGNIMKHAINGRLASDSNFVEGTDSIKRIGIELWDNFGVYKAPVEIAVTATDETVALNDGTISVTIANSWDGDNYEISIDGTTYQSVLTDFTGLAPQEYSVTARHTTDLKDSLVTKITVNQYIAPE